MTGSDTLDARTVRALEEPMSVVETDGTPIDDPERSIVMVASSSGACYTVDLREGRCTCPDHQYRRVQCAHLRRARFATGRDPLPADAVAALDVDPQLGEHTAAELRFAAADGGVVENGSGGGESERGVGQ